MKSLVGIILGASAILLGSCTGHRDVVKEMEAYSPPAVYQAVKAEPETRKPPDPSPGDKAFEAQKEKLEEMRKDWEKALSSPIGKNLFSYP